MCIWAPYNLKKSDPLIIGYKKIRKTLFYLCQPFTDTHFMLSSPIMLQYHLYTFPKHKSSSGSENTCKWLCKDIINTAGKLYWSTSSKCGFSIPMQPFWDVVASYYRLLSFCSTSCAGKNIRRSVIRLQMDTKWTNMNYFCVMCIWNWPFKIYLVLFNF